MNAIRKLIHQGVPGVEEVISYSIPCFKYKGFLIYYSAYTKHISLAHPWSDGFLKKFEKDLKGYKVSKSSIQLPNDQPLPTEFLKRIIEFRKKENEAAAKSKK